MSARERVPRGEHDAQAAPLPTIRYRPADLTDVPRLVGLPRPGEAGGDPRMLRYLAGEHHPRQALPPRVMWMAEEDADPVGYAAGHLTRRLGCDGELQWIYVVRRCRRAGVGAELLRRVALWSLDQGASRICVDVGDEEARSFYRRLGATDLSPHWMVWEHAGALAARAARLGRAG
ncbi:MAG TPA: GNAT family N-acetyltransferase [Thermoanaerobaculia bacterium]|nr:GNAT family N-acetyltransferase [Thermoanaerobaculia bacterium]